MPEVAEHGPAQADPEADSDPDPAPGSEAPARHPAADHGPGARPEPTRDTADENVSYANCAAVRAAGAAPIHAGEPGYSRRLDRDGDGVGCEN